MKEIIKNIKNTLNTYYLTISLLSITTIYLNILIYLSYNQAEINDSNLKLILTLIFGSIVSLVIKHILMRFKNNNYLYLIIPLSMLIVYFGILNDLNSHIPIMQYLILDLSLILSLFAIPFINKKNDSYYYTYKLLVSLLITFIAYILLILGILGTLFSISLLFEINIASHLYTNISIFILGIIMPSIFLTIIPQMNVKNEAYPNYINKIIMFVILPILIIYTFVLYAYFLKILLEFNWPSNMLGNLIIYYSLISIIVLYFINNISNKYTNLFKKIYPYTLIIPLIMMLITFIIRINEYGFTEIRYYGILLFIFVLLSILLIKKMHKVKYIPIVLSVLLLISAFGPMSSFNISINSQEKRLENILIDNNMLINNKIIINNNINEESKDKIRSIITYFYSNNLLDRIDVLPNNFKIENMEEVFGFSYLKIIEY